MLIHIQHAIQNELAPDRLLFRFEAAAAHDRLGTFGRWIRRAGAEDAPVETVEILRGDRLFFQLPPAAGAFSFQMPSASRAECHIMVSPLNSLDRRGQTSLRMTPRFSDDGTHIVYTELWVDRLRLLYVSPESLISRTFREDLSRIIKGSPPGGLIIDEAHAISEWGGSFRSAYQRIPRMIEDLRRGNPRLAVLAVTAASGKWIGRDVRAMLDLEDRSPPLRRNVYRERVSHQAAVVRSPEEKEAAYEQLLWRDIPALLAREGVVDPAAEAFPQYRDPYAPCLELAPAGRAAPADVAVAQRRFGDSGSRHILIHTGMGDRVTDWLYKTGDAGRGRRRLHCIRLADLPSDDCEADLDARQTRIPRCSGQVCAFGRGALCDYGKQHHLIQRSHPAIREAFSDILRTLDGLLTISASGDPPARIPLPDGDGGRTETALHRLSLLGVIDIFFVDYRESPPAFKIYGFKPEIAGTALALRLLRFLKKHDVSHAGPPTAGAPEPPSDTPESRVYPSFEIMGEGFEAAAWLREAHADAPFAAYERHPGLFHRVAAYLSPTLHYVSENLKRMRYRRLWNLKSFMRARLCRQAALIRSVHAVDAEWRCDACDRCRPDPAGDLMGSSPAGAPRPPEALEGFLRDWLEADGVRFDEEAGAILFDRFADRAADLTARAERLLEEDPRNLKALHLLVRFSGGRDRQRHERDLREACDQQRSLARVLRLCDVDPDGEAMLKALADLSGDGSGGGTAPLGMGPDALTVPSTNPRQT
ncbi:hypothetical protein [Desulfococcus sp.]|uniref:hypothetical protein n=1 Tax=Desulfococcus sp. TaxID=2025834 RepID=UPI0035942096